MRALPASVFRSASAIGEIPSRPSKLVAEVGEDEVEDYAWFPAWLLIIKPAVTGRLGEARVQRDLPASRATALLGEILRREREGEQHELIALRQEIRRLHSGLFDIYMATRNVQHR